MCRVPFISAASVSLLCGCGRPRDERVIPLALAGAAVAAALMANVDVDRDGLVMQKEMHKVPTLANARALTLVPEPLTGPAW